MTNLQRWEQLLSRRTFRTRSEQNPTDARNAFESDYSRIISSSSFRRLQDKAQVFPLKRGDFVRTRLTHSLEVSHIGNSLGRSIENKLKEKGSLDETLMGALPNILATAGLVHDLGNPPFGHYGEYAIQSYFKNFFSNGSYKLSDQQKKDLENFDGNVQTFRILKKLQYLGDEHSYNLTFPTLATIIKYPNNSVDGNKGKKAKNIKDKKFGYFISEQENYKEINDELNLKNNRHPLVFLLEAADDIAYCVADIEDGAQKKLIKLKDIEEKIEEILKREKDSSAGIAELNELKNKIQSLKEEWEKNLPNNKPLRNKVIIQKLKIYIQGKMISGVVEFFVNNEENIINGELDLEILESSNYCLVKKVFSELAIENIFTSKEVVEGEILSYQVIEKLLDIFINATLDVLKNKENASKQSVKIKSLISENYKYIYKTYELSSESSDEERDYATFKLCVDFISGMTDNFALYLFKKLTGIKN